LAWFDLTSFIVVAEHVLILSHASNEAKERFNEVYAHVSRLADSARDMAWPPKVTKEELVGELEELEEAVQELDVAGFTLQAGPGGHFRPEDIEAARKMGIHLGDAEEVDQTASDPKGGEEEVDEEAEGESSLVSRSEDGGHL
jgi:hypothetical protein